MQSQPTQTNDSIYNDPKRKIQYINKLVILEIRRKLDKQ